MLFAFALLCSYIVKKRNTSSMSSSHRKINISLHVFKQSSFSNSDAVGVLQRLCGVRLLKQPKKHDN